MPGYYLDWAQKEWAWFLGSGLVNPSFLVNDGLNGNCTNNNQTTWTYNQGVLLNGAALLSTATGNSSALSVASKVASAAMTLLVDASSGMFEEPCGAGGCDGDQDIFKGVFARHLSAMLQTGTTSPALQAQAASFLTANAASVLSNSSCETGGYGLLWQGPCGENVTVSTTSAALDLFTAASSVNAMAAPAFTRTAILGLGNCEDAAGLPMPNCYNSNVTRAACEAALSTDSRAVAYDFEEMCGEPRGFCRIRTTSGQESCLPTWTYSNGAASNVSRSDGSALTVCVVLV